ncbi:MAG TPA: transcriptional repressor [Planctomycetes bacterium]|nr:transcriptional repressor [Fuerstiella sp.]HIK95769.1 transcriptional repressor [Planctomycetota bacterium]
MIKGRQPQQLSLEAARSVLQGVGMRCTAARIAVIQCLDAAASPMTPVGVVDALSEYGFDKSTIYRSLSELNEAGIVVRLDLGDAVRRFELVPLDSDGASEHPHFMCIDCGKVVCMSGFDVELKGRSRKARAPGIMSEVLVRGHCHDCAT